MLDPDANLFFGVPHRFLVLEVDLVVLEGTPEAFGHDVVQSAASAIHADPHTGAAQNTGEIRACEGCALVGVDR